MVSRVSRGISTNLGGSTVIWGAGPRPALLGIQRGLAVPVLCSSLSKASVKRGDHRDVRIGVFPHARKLFPGRGSAREVAGIGQRSRKLQTRQRPDGVGQRESRMVENFLELSSRFDVTAQPPKCQAPNVDGIKCAKEGSAGKVSRSGHGELVRTRGARHLDGFQWISRV